MGITTTYYSGSNAAGSSDYVRVGHGSSALRPDAVWKLVIAQEDAKAITGMSASFAWDNAAGGEGWRGEYDYKAAIYGSDNSTVRATAVFPMSGAAGTKTIAFSGLALAPGTYYLHLNQNGSTYSTLKSVRKNSMSCAITSYQKKANIWVNAGGAWKEGRPYVNVNGVWKEAQGVYVNVGGTWRQSS